MYPQDSIEDRIHKNGKHEEFSKAVKTFEDSNGDHHQQNLLYEKLEELGCSSEEASEFVDMMAQS